MDLVMNSRCLWAGHDCPVEALRSVWPSHWTCHLNDSRFPLADASLDGSRGGNRTIEHERELAGGLYYSRVQPTI
jgi:hypothetical protein